MSVNTCAQRTGKQPCCLYAYSVVFGDWLLEEYCKLSFLFQAEACQSSFWSGKIFFPPKVQQIERTLFKISILLMLKCSLQMVQSVWLLVLKTATSKSLLAVSLFSCWAGCVGVAWGPCWGWNCWMLLHTSVLGLLVAACGLFPRVSSSMHILLLSTVHVPPVQLVMYLPLSLTEVSALKDFIGMKGRCLQLCHMWVVSAAGFKSCGGRK